jgi:hypothetical protein
MYFVYGFCAGNVYATVEEYRTLSHYWPIPSNCVFSRVHQTVPETGCFPCVCVPSEREAVPDNNIKYNLLEMVERSLKLSTHITASRNGVLGMEVWRILQEEDLHHYQELKFQQLEL